MSEIKQSRGHWGSRLGFVLAATGSAIGLGNLWKFPYITYENGGGAFVLIYLFCILLIGIPIMLAELLLGKRTQSNPVGAFGVFRPEQPVWKLVGVLGVFTGFVILSYYSVIAGWTIEYSMKAVMGQFSTVAPEKAGEMFVAFLGNPYKQMLWHFVFMAMTVAIVIGGVSKGIERWSKILMPALIAIILFLTFQALRLDGARQAVVFIFNPDFSQLTSHSVLEALGHAFFTLSLGMGAMLTYGSYMEKKVDIVKAGVIVAVMDTVIAIMACLMMYPIIFTNKVEVKESIGIIFTSIPALLARLPFGNMLAVMFFLLVCFAALTSAISLLEVVVSWGVDELNWRRKPTTLLLASVVFAFGVPSALCNGTLPLFSAKFFPKGGGEWLNYLDAWDYLASNWFLPIGGFMTAVFVGWVLKKEEVIGEFPSKTHKVIYVVWRFLLKFLTPVGVLVVMLYKLGALNFIMAK